MPCGEALRRARTPPRWRTDIARPGRCLSFNFDEGVHTLFPITVDMVGADVLLFWRFLMTMTNSMFLFWLVCFNSNNK